ncbi:MAG: response regulator [Acidobacteria bacterium]|nr:response regulator [Acidobacteriota bacterium]
MRLLAPSRSFRHTLRRIMMATTASALLLACFSFVAVDYFTARQSVESDLSSLAAVIGSNSAAALVFNDHQAARTVLSALREQPSVVSACLYDQQRALFEAYVGTQADSPCRDRAPFAGMRHHGTLFSVTRAVMFDGKRVGTISLASDLSGFFDRIKRYALLASGILILSLLAALGISAALQRSISEPILHLAEVTDKVRRDRNYAIRVGLPESAPDEVAVLYDAFDDMLAATQLRNEDLEHLVAARTTELRSANAELVHAHNLAQRNADVNARLSHHRQAILDATAEGIFGLDERGRATFLNTSAARILGYAPGELIGQYLHPLLHPELEVGPVDECAVCSSTLQPSPRRGGDGVFVSSTGREIPVDFTTTAMRSDGAQSRGVVVTFRDLTERREVERMKDEFVSTVSHELRTPMTSIRGALGLLSSGLMGAVTPAAQQMLSIAVGNTDRLIRLINDILDLEKLKNGELEQTLTSSADIAVEAIDGVRVVADRAGVTILSEVSTDMLWIDRDRILQTLTNLLGNAIKFSPSGSAVHVIGRAHGDWFRFSVIDRGRGIPKAKLEAIFERFQQVDASDSRDKGGTGLGLAISRSIVTAHGGRIWVESREDHGSVFHFTVPLRKRAASSASEEPVLVPRPVAAKAAEEERAVLIVEDDADLARVVAQTLQNENVPVLWAANGATAMQLLASQPPALVILDLILPDRSGFKLIEQIRSMPGLQETPIVVYSAFDVSPTDETRIRLGAGTFLTKSRVSLNELVQTVLALTGRSMQEEIGAA